MSDTLTPGQELAVGAVIQSPNGRFILTFQNDGNLVVYDTSTNPWTALWNSRTPESGASRCIFQTDGNLVLYRSDGAPVWASGSITPPDAWCRIQDDGNCVIYYKQNNIISSEWDSFADNIGGREYCIRIVDISVIGGRVVRKDNHRARTRGDARRFGDDVLRREVAGIGNINRYRADIELGRCP
jgi:hypothetical protein